MSRFFLPAVFTFVAMISTFCAVQGPPIAVAFAEFDASGVFRPVYWMTVSVVNGSPWIAAGIALTTMIAFVWLLIGFRIETPIAVVLVMLWLWHPLHAGLWEQLGLAESIALPFAILAVVFAHRARSGRSRLWDAGWIVFTIVAVLSRNSFLGIVPAIALMRLGTDELPGRAAAWCGAMLILGGVGLSSSLGLGASPELVVVGLGVYLLIATFLNGIVEMPLLAEGRSAWVGVGAALVFVLAWNLTQTGASIKMF